MVPRRRGAAVKLCMQNVKSEAFWRFALNFSESEKRA
jgi:hypothetical protein